MQTLAIVLFAISVALRAQPAIGAPTPGRAGVELNLERGPGTERCIDAPALERNVETRLQRSVFLNETEPFIRIFLRLSHVNERTWSAELRLVSDDGKSLGERTLVTKAAHCSALDDSLALVVALLVDAPLGEREAELAASERSASTPRASDAETNASGMPTTLELPASTVAPREPWQWRATGGASLALGLLPGAGVGVELGVRARPARGPELSVFAQGYARREASSGDGAGAHFDALFVGFEICPLETEVARIRFAACVGQNLGRLHVAAFGYDQNSSATRLLYNVLARGRVSIPLLGPLSAQLSARSEVPLSRPLFYYGARENIERDVFQPSAILAVIETGLSVAL